MKLTVIVFVIFNTLFCFGQNAAKLTLADLIVLAQTDSFEEDATSGDSILVSLGFDFNKFTPTDNSFDSLYFKTYYDANVIELIECYSSQSSRLKYSCSVNDFDSIMFFRFSYGNTHGRLNNLHLFGTSIKTMGLTLIIACHDQALGDTIFESFDAENDWLSCHKYSPISVFIVDEDLSPLYRLYFVNKSLLTISLCKERSKVCTEYVNVYNHLIKGLFPNGPTLESINAAQLESIKIFTTIWPTYILQHDFQVSKYYFKWEYYRELIKIDGLND